VSDRDRLIACFRHAVEAALPGPAVARALGEEDDGRIAPVILSIGKAAVPMAEAAVDHLSRRGTRPAGGLVVAPDAAGFDALPVIEGEHPVPGVGSRRAALAIARLCRDVSPDTPVWCLLSGGTTSLIGGPDEGLREEELDAAWRVLLTSGLDITAMNAVRKRLTRWGGGKLARALAHTVVLQLIVSDVIADDLPSIGSGPLVPDPLTATEVVAALRGHGTWSHLPAAVRERLEAMAAGGLPDAPVAGDPVFRRVRSRIIVSNRMAMEAAAEDAGQAGWEALPIAQPLEGEAVAAAEWIVAAMRTHARGSRPGLLIYGGETTVTIPRGTAALVDAPRNWRLPPPVCWPRPRVTPASSLRPGPTGGTAPPTRPGRSWIARPGGGSNGRVWIRRRPWPDTTRIPPSRRPAPCFGLVRPEPT
jgi:glycerate 2-kinase